MCPLNLHLRGECPLTLVLALVMLKLSLCAPVLSQMLETRALGEVEKNSFIALSDEGGHSGLMPSKLCVPTQGSRWLRQYSVCLQCKTQVQFLGWEDFLEKEIATHSSILAWKIPWLEEPGRLQAMGSQRVRLSDFTFTFHFFAMAQGWGY